MVPDTEVLVVGAGPVGLTAAIELCRRGISCRIVDALPEPPQYAKAVGIQPRTLEVFEGMGVLNRILNAAVLMRGHIVYVNGDEVMRIELGLPHEVPFGFVGLPQYETERILTEYLGEWGTFVERGSRLTSFHQDEDTVTAALEGPNGGESVHVRYLVGCDGAHSIVRKGLGLTFEGAAFDEQYMLADVEVDWTQPNGYGIRSMHVTDGATDDLLVCIPLPGRGRYRMSMFVPDGVLTPKLGHIQEVLDRLSPEAAKASNLRWSSVFKISHRIVDSYGHGRVFVAGDAAHIHPPTGAQGMNTGIQDAHNLAWKIALTTRGAASPTLLQSYDAERRPVGEEVVGRTVRHARQGVGAGVSDPVVVLLREAQLLINYAGSPIVGGDFRRSPAPGDRAPDARGLTRDAVAFPVRLFSILDGVRHTLVLYAASSTEIDTLEAVAEAAVTAAHEKLAVYVVAASDGVITDTKLPVLRDVDGGFAAAYRVAETSIFVVRPDGYLGFRTDHVNAESVLEYLKETFR